MRSGNGTVTYSKYDARGHARRIQDGVHDLATTYDAAERLTQVAQADASGNPGTPVLTTLVYATANTTNNYKNGKLEIATAANPDLTTASVVETYTYGGLGGRVSARQTVVEGRIINQAFTWNDLGQVASLGYPNDTALADAVEPPRTVSYTYANAALTAVPSYLSSISYHSNSMVNTVTHANGTKVVHGKDANDMARPASITLQRVSDSAVLWQTGAYAYDGAGNIKTLGSDWTTYDGVNRLTVGTTSAGALRQCTSYNAFGALTGLGTGTTSCTPSAISVDAATNRLASPVTYDAAGNMTAWGGKTYSWTRDNRMLTTTGTGINRSYVYTSDGERVLDRNNLDSTRTLWIRDLSGKVLREYGRTGAGVWSWGKDYVYREGLVQATIQPPKAGGAPLVKHLHLDHLGTVRRMTDTQATPQLVATASRDLYPFGLEATSSTDTERMRFTGHQRDTQGTTAQADDVDYMHARYYNPTVGRFLSIDPVRGNPKTPQSWNLYSYVRNNPINATDPDGRLFWPKAWQVVKFCGRTVANVVRVEARNKKQAVVAIRKAAEELRQTGHTLQVEAKSRNAAEGLAAALSDSGRVRGPEKSPGFAKHFNAEDGPDADLHIAWAEGKDGSGWTQISAAFVFAGFKEIVAPNSVRVGRMTDATSAEVASAAVWDITTTLDPIGLTDAISYLSGLD